jgi:effector-binding domain-containing protein
MLSTPVVVYHQERPYVAIEKKVKPIDIGRELPPLHGELYAWLAKNDLTPIGPPFFLYLAMNQAELLVRVGFCLVEKVAGEAQIMADAFPAGNYAELVYTGDYKNLMQAHMALEAWIKDNNLREKTSNSQEGCAWGARTEFYLNDCTEIPNPAEWQTQVTFLLEG